MSLVVKEWEEGVAARLLVGYASPETMEPSTVSSAVTYTTRSVSVGRPLIVHSEKTLAASTATFRQLPCAMSALPAPRPFRTSVEDGADAVDESTTAWKNPFSFNLTLTAMLSPPIVYAVPLIVGAVTSRVVTSILMMDV